VAAWIKVTDGSITFAPNAYCNLSEICLVKKIQEPDTQRFECKSAAAVLFLILSSTETVEGDAS